jgi:dihydrofolate synthase/folylpolyglutamate synthase
MKTLDEWLAHCERLHPKSIDLGLDRVRAVATRMGLRPAAPVIAVAGTNGKGSTCAMLESILRRAGFRAGLYTSPHLVHFEERCRIAGQMADADALAAAFEVVENARDDVSLTYFEFTTLAILQAFSQASLDVWILEVGLGGRLDAVNVLDADCAIVTCVDIDHAALLGATREQIGLEKAGILRAGRPAIVSDPAPPQSVLDHAQKLGADLWLPGRDYSFGNVDRTQWGWAGRARRYSGLAHPALRGANQLLNAAGVLAALEALRAQLPVTAQAIRAGLALVELPGRFQVLPGQPAVVLDVGHNPHAATALAANLDAMGFYAATHAVFGAMADKDLAAMLQRLGPLVEHWYFTDLPIARAASARQLMALWQGQNPRRGTSAHCFADPSQALAAARAAAQAADRIIITGSFYTVGGVLAHGLGGV